jgi:DNA (cytosine-5)-methyltransferase 1
MADFLEFFAGGGMARIGLGADWNCQLVNDIDPKKINSYSTNFGSLEPIYTCDVGDLKTKLVRKKTDLAWASFPCQDVSLAGYGQGLNGKRSGTFWSYWGFIEELITENKGPRIIALENVVGLLSSKNGFDFIRLCSVISEAGYLLGAMVIDASKFLPQSRPRLFIIAVDPKEIDTTKLTTTYKDFEWGHKILEKAYDAFPEKVKQNWRWWNLPSTPSHQYSLEDIIEDSPQDVKLHSKEQTEKLISMMSERNLAKILKAQRSRKRKVFTMYRRTRICPDMGKVQRVEVRTDGLAGCLRTPAGGSSRQLLIFVDKNVVKTRLMSKREGARLMGLPESYKLPKNYNESYHLTGDGVAVPVVSFLSEKLFRPLLGTVKQNKTSTVLRQQKIA